jgi:hypothetical protein
MPYKTMTDESHRLTKTITIAHDDPAKIEDALGLFRDIPGMAAWEAAETRTTITENGTTDELLIEGAEDDGDAGHRLSLKLELPVNMVYFTGCYSSS